jgi:hypothetical protein
MHTFRNGYTKTSSMNIKDVFKKHGIERRIGKEES